MMWNSRRHFVMCALVLLLVSCSLWAFPGRYAEADIVIPEISEIHTDIQEVLPAVPEAPQEPVVLQTSAPELPPPSETISEEGLNQLQELLGRYESVSRLSRDELTKLIGELETIRTEYELLVEDVEAKETQIETLKTDHAAQLAEITALNNQQADDLAYLRGAYDKETATKAYAKMGLVIGFEDMMPTWGLSGSLGCRIGKGLLLELGSQVMLGNFVDNPIWMPTMDNVAFTGSIGWEW